MNKLSNILNGWENFLVKSEVIEKVAKERAEHCKLCPHAKEGMLTALIKDELKEIQGQYCDKCACPLSAKIRSKNETCPLGLWKQQE